MYEGIDVSKWQGTIDWKKAAAAPVSFAMLRATYGLRGIDASFRRNAEQTALYRLPIGAYHYCYAKTPNDALREADHFLNTVKGVPMEYPLALDLEDKSLSPLSKKQLSLIALKFLDRVREMGYYPILYVNKYWLTSKLDMALLKGFDVWLAQYADTLGYRKSVGIWQYTSNGKINGIHGNCDRDLSFKNYPKIIRELHLNHLKGDETVDDKTEYEKALKLIQDTCGFDDNTMLYLQFYRYAESMVKRLAKAIQH